MSSKLSLALSTPKKKRREQDYDQSKYCFKQNREFGQVLFVITHAPLYRFVCKQSYAFGKINSQTMAARAEGMLETRCLGTFYIHCTISKNYNKLGITQKLAKSVDDHQQMKTFFLKSPNYKSLFVLMVINRKLWKNTRIFLMSFVILVKFTVP